MNFDNWWELNAQYCKGAPAKLIALRAWLAVKTHHRIPHEDGEWHTASFKELIEHQIGHLLNSEDQCQPLDSITPTS